MKKSKKILFVLFSMALLISGCASVPMADDAADKRAKEFKPKNGKANIYIYRNEFIGAALHMPVDVNGKNVGTTAANSFIFLEVKPGKYDIVSDGNKKKDDIISINAQAKKNYYVWQEIKMGFMAGQTKLSKVDEKTGRKGVLECQLVK